MSLKQGNFKGMMWGEVDVHKNHKQQQQQLRSGLDWILAPNPWNLNFRINITLDSLASPVNVFFLEKVKVKKPTT